MLSTEQKKIIEEYKDFYKQIGKVACPYFQNDFVHFNRKGFNHLLRKGKNGRPFFKQTERLGLLKYCKRILSAKHEHVAYRETSKSDTIARFWGFYGAIEDFGVVVVVTQINQGQKYFFSIYKTLNTPRGSV
ncbi:MAG: hypothetical protein WCT02_04760 [Candidatus Paceibacterota bacterium]